MLAITYLSTATNSFNNQSLDALAENSAKKNSKYGITGYLYYEVGQFVQYLEGEDKHVLQLLNNIERDSRHTIINVFQEQNLKKRRFVEWNMNRISQSDLVEIKLENIWRDLLRWSYNPLHADLEEQIWRLVTRMAELHEKQRERKLHKKII